MGTKVAREQIDPEFEFASEAEAQTGTEDTKIMTALKVAKSLETNLPYASQAEAEAGTENTKVMTALRVAQSITASGTLVHDHSNAANGGPIDNAAIGTSALTNCIAAVKAGTPGKDEINSQSLCIGRVRFDAAGAIIDSYNVTSVLRTGVGLFLITWDRDAAVGYTVVATAFNAGGVAIIAYRGAQAAGTVEIRVADTAAVLVDPNEVSVVAFGTQVA